MTAEEQQDQAFEDVAKAKAKKRADGVALQAAQGVEASRQAARDKAYQAFLAADAELDTARRARFAIQTTFEIDDTVAVAKASQAYNEAMQNHGLILT